MSISVSFSVRRPKSFNPVTGQPEGGLENVEPTPKNLEQAVALRLVASSSEASEALENAKKLAPSLGFAGALKTGSFSDGSVWVTVGKGNTTGVSVDDLKAKFGL